MGLSNLGIFHTVIGVIAIVATLVSFVKHGKINLAVLSGKIYFYGTIVASLTALGISKHGGFNPGHAISILIVVLVVVAFYLFNKKGGNNKARYFENFLLSFSFFLSMLPTVNETLTRIPIGHPLATDITDPLIGKTLLAILILFIAGSIYQFRMQKKINAVITRYFIPISYRKVVAKENHKMNPSSSGIILNNYLKSTGVRSEVEVWVKVTPESVTFLNVCKKISLQNEVIQLRN